MWRGKLYVWRECMTRLNSWNVFFFRSWIIVTCATKRDPAAVHLWCWCLLNVIQDTRWNLWKWLKSGGWDVCWLLWHSSWVCGSREQFVTFTFSRTVWRRGSELHVTCESIFVICLFFGCSPPGSGTRPWCKKFKTKVWKLKLWRLEFVFVWFLDYDFSRKGCEGCVFSLFGENLNRESFHSVVLWSTCPQDLPYEEIWRFVEWSTHAWIRSLS